MSRQVRLNLAVRRALPEWLKTGLRLARIATRPAPPSAPVIAQELLGGCRFFAYREIMLEALPKGGVVCELGTYKGDFARRILSAATPRVLDIVDVHFGLFDHAIAKNPAVRTHQMLTTEFLASQPDGRYDWIYVDADHGYEAVEADILAAKAKVRPGGYLVFNDFARVVRPGFGQFGVHQAVCEFAASDRWAVTHFAFNGEALYDIALQRPLT